MHARREGGERGAHVSLTYISPIYQRHIMKRETNKKEPNTNKGKSKALPSEALFAARLPYIRQCWTGVVLSIPELRDVIFSLRWYTLLPHVKPLEKKPVAVPTPPYYTLHILLSPVEAQRKLVTNNHAPRNCYSLLMRCVSGALCLDRSSRQPETSIEVFNSSICIYMQQQPEIARNWEICWISLRDAAFLYVRTSDKRKDLMGK